MAIKKKLKSKKPLTVRETVTEPVASTKQASFNPDFGFVLKLIVVILIGASIFMIARRYRGQFIAATINKEVITRYELNQSLTKRYGQTVLDEMVADRLLRQEAKKQSITVNTDEVKKELDDLSTRLGGDQALTEALKQYGLSLEDLKAQIELRLLQKKIAEKLLSVEVKAEEVKAYFDENKTVYKDKKFDDVKAEIEESLKTQKLQQEFAKWFEELKTNSQVQTYL
jgi:foldase protein PrsA